ncbi:MAG TPA: PAS domain S-box protein [Candidatus Binataceae bacterium]|nr:PAS domain S-box protein [Candidatus Binataceae bacterium]
MRAQDRAQETGTDVQGGAQAPREVEAELRARLTQQEAIATLGLRALRTVEVGPLLDDAVAAVARTLGLEYCEVLELQADGRMLLLRAGVGWNEGLVGNATVSAGLDSQAGYTLSTRQPVMVEDLARDGRFSGPSLLREHGVVSGISTVIGNPDRPWGVLGAYTRSRRKFTRDDANFVQAAANVLAGAVERMSAEAALRAAQAYTRGLIEASVDAMLTIDDNLAITDVNEQMARMSEMPRTMLIGSRFDACFTDPERAAAGVHMTLREGAVTNYDLTLRAASGKELLVSFNASIFYDAAGKPRGVFALARDVSEQRRIERELRRERNYSRALLESSVDALFAIDPDMRITDVNEQTVTFTGYSRAELTGAPFPSLFTEPEHAAAGVRTTLAEGVVRDYELTVRSATGRELPVSFNASIFRDDTGEVRGVFAAARDIAERRRLERERSLLASVVASATDAIYSYRPDTTVTSWNAGAERLYGYSAAEIVGRSITACVPLDRRAELHERIARVLRKEGIQRFESVRRRKDSSLVQVALAMSPIIEQSGEVSGVAVTARELGERLSGTTSAAGADNSARPVVSMKQGSGAAPSSVPAAEGR